MSAARTTPFRFPPPSFVLCLMCALALALALLSGVSGRRMGRISLITSRYCTTTTVGTFRGPAVVKRFLGATRAQVSIGPGVTAQNYLVVGAPFLQSISQLGEYFFH